MRPGILLFQRLRGQRELPPDRLGDPPERHVFGHGVTGLVPAAPFQTKARHVRGDEPVNGWPEVLSISDTGETPFSRGPGGKHETKPWRFPQPMDRARKAHDGLAPNRELSELVDPAHSWAGSRHEEKAVRELILKMSISIDGFVADQDGGIDWVFGSDREAKAWIVETLWNASLHIMGSRTFNDMAAFWPTSTDVFTQPMNQIPKAVFSRQGRAILKSVNTTAALNDARADAGAGPSAEPQPGAESWAQAYVASGDLADEIAKLKAQEGKPIVAHGGAGFARSLVAQGLVDQFALMVHPVALGRGLPVFSDLAAQKRLKLVSSKAFPGGAVAQSYRAA